MFGMTSEQFWYDDPDLYYIYQSAYIEKNKMVDYNAWLQGRYILDALSQVLQFKNPKQIFPDQPYHLLKTYSPKQIKEIVENTDEMVETLKKYFNNKNSNK